MHAQEECSKLTREENPALDQLKQKLLLAVQQLKHVVQPNWSTTPSQYPVTYRQPHRQLPLGLLAADTHQLDTPKLGKHVCHTLCTAYKEIQKVFETRLASCASQQCSSSTIVNTGTHCRLCEFQLQSRRCLQSHVLPTNGRRQG
jgi:hypothetical protein